MLFASFTLNVQLAQRVEPFSALRLLIG